MAEKKQEFKPVEIFKVEINFDELEKWRDSTKDDLPVVGYMSFYRAIGLLDAAEKYAKELTEEACSVLDDSESGEILKELALYLLDRKN